MCLKSAVGAHRCQFSEESVHKYKCRSCFNFSDVMTHQTIFLSYSLWTLYGNRKAPFSFHEKKKQPDRYIFGFSQSAYKFGLTWPIPTLILPRPELYPNLVYITYLICPSSCIRYNHPYNTCVAQISFSIPRSWWYLWWPDLTLIVNIARWFMHCTLSLKT